MNLGTQCIGQSLKMPKPVHTGFIKA